MLPAAQMPCSPCQYVRVFDDLLAAPLCTLTSCACSHANNVCLASPDIIFHISSHTSSLPSLLHHYGAFTGCTGDDYDCHNDHNRGKGKLSFNIHCNGHCFMSLRLPLPENTDLKRVFDPHMFRVSCGGLCLVSSSLEGWSRLFEDKLSYVQIKRDLCESKCSSKRCLKVTYRK